MIFRKGSPETISLGDTSVDLIASVSQYPRCGGDSEISVLQRHPGGSAANFAVAIARLGISAGLISKVGSDETGEFLRNGLRREDVDVSHLKQENGATGTIFVIVDKKGSTNDVVLQRSQRETAARRDTARIHCRL